MPNPSTMQAATETDYHYASAQAHNLRRSKSDREQWLREARRLAAELGIEGPPPINGRPAGPTVFEQQKAEAKRFITERATALGWFKTHTDFGPRLTKKGNDEALSALIGFHTALEFALGAGGSKLGPLCFLSSIRGVDFQLLNDNPEK